MFLIDTDVLSALSRPRRNERVSMWFAQRQKSELYISVISIGEIERGIDSKRRDDAAHADRLAIWLGQILAAYDERILPFELRAARRWGQLSAAIGNNNPDLQIAATALEHGLTVVTRNISHFALAGVKTVDPFEPQ